MHDKIFDPLNDGKSKIEILNIMGSDLTIVNDAKASYNNEAKEFTEKEEKLLSFLIINKHMSPFRGSILKLRITAPLYICRQWWKHIIGSNHASDQIAWNETSYRYKKFKNVYYIPEKLRKQSSNNKQGSEDFNSFDSKASTQFLERYEQICQESFNLYHNMIEQGIAKEQARGILPQCIYTTWIWTTSLQALLNFIELRKATEAQYEIHEYSKILEEIVKNNFPYTFKYWFN